MLLTHPFLLQVFGVEADAKNLPQHRSISPQSRSPSPDYPFLYYLCTG
ncbi:transposase [Escherichia coli]|nr:transposase [Escherichia coli]